MATLINPGELGRSFVPRAIEAGLPAEFVGQMSEWGQLTEPAQGVFELLSRPDPKEAIRLVVRFDTGKGLVSVYDEFFHAADPRTFRRVRVEGVPVVLRNLRIGEVESPRWETVRQASQETPAIVAPLLSGKDELVITKGGGVVWAM